MELAALPPLPQQTPVPLPQMPQQILRAPQPFLPQALVAPRHEGPRMMMTIASSTLLLYLHEPLRPRVQHLSLHAPVLSMDVLGHSCKTVS